SSPEAASSVSTGPEHDKEIPIAVATDTTATADDSEPKIEQVTPADMEPQTPPTPAGMQETIDPLAVAEESPEISTTSIEPEMKSSEDIESTIKDTEQTVEQDPLARALSEEARTSEEEVLNPSTSAQPTAVKEDTMSMEKCAEVSESIPTSTSSPDENPETSRTNTAEDEKCSGRIPTMGTPPPLVESSTASPEKAAPVVDDSSAAAPGDGSVYTTTSTVDSSSGSGDKTGDSNVETVTGPSSNSSDIVNSISNDCSSSSSSSSIGNGKEAESQSTATENGSTSLEANTTTMDADDRARPLSSTIVPPSTVEEAAHAVIEKDALADSVETAAADEKQPQESLARLDESRQGCDGNNSERDGVNGQEDAREIGSNPSDDQMRDETKSVPSSAFDANGQEKREKTCLEHRESSAMPPDPDTGPPVSEKKVPLADFRSTENCNNKNENIAANSNASPGEEHYNPLPTSQTMEVESSQNDNMNGSGDNRMLNTLSTGATTGRSDHYLQQQQTPPVSARNPLQFTEVANDEVELKVDGGHLLDRVIKLSLLKGLQDSGKRLAKSSLIISGAGASIGEGANGEATLATTSSLSKAKSAAAGLRLMEEHKTTPPALVANGAAVNGIEAAPVAVTEIASSTKEPADSQNHPTAQSGGRIRHSSDTTVSSSPSGELDGGVRSSSNSSLDFREEERSPTAQAQEATSPASSLEPSSNRSSATREPASVQPTQNNNNEHLPVKARKPQYYASIPDFSKQQFSSAASMSTVSTSTTTGAKSLAQLHMKTPDFSRLVPGTVPSSQTSPSSTTTNAAISTVASSSMRTTSELKISNPDFTKGFGAQHHSQYSSSAHAVSYPSAQEQPSSGGNSSSPYVTPDTFSKLIKERNYIADLQLKNPPPSQQSSAESQQVGKSAGSQNDYPPSRIVVVDTTSVAVGSTAPYGHATSSPVGQYRRPSPIENGMEQEPKAHVIHKTSGGSSAPPQPPPPPPPPAQSAGGHHAPKTWNPPEFSSKHFTHGPPSHSRPAAGSNGAGPSSTSPSSRDPSPAPSSSSPHQPSYGQHPGGLVNYAGKSSHTGTTSVAGSERIIVNNVRTYYPEASVPPASASVPPSGTSSSSYPSLPKVKDPEFRLDQNKEQLLLQEGTIVTVKQPYSNHTTGRGQLPPPTTVRSPSAERREAQMMQHSQDILYRDYKHHKKPTSSVSPGGSNTRPVGSSQSSVDRRSPYDPAAYYSQSMHHHRPPIIPPQGSSGLMHPPPPNWPGSGQHLPPHHIARAAVGPGARSSPQDNGASPVSSPAPLPAGQHHYHPHPHQAPYYGQYKNAPSPATPSPTSTPSPVPSPLHRKYSGPPSRDPSPQGQQPQQPHQHHRYGGSNEAMYHVPAGGPPAMYVHSGAPKPGEQGAAQQSMPPASHYQSQPSSSSSSYSSVTTTYSNRPHHAGAVVSPNHPNSVQQSVISGNPYDRYVHAYATGGQSHPASGGQQQQQQQQTHHSKPSLPYPPAGRLQGPPPLQPAPPSATGQSQPVIQPPLTGMDFSPNFQKHIPARNPGPNGAPGVGLPAVDVRQPHEPPQHPTPSPTRHVSVISPAIPPGYDKKTDAYMSANYRAVGGPLATPAYQYSAGPTRLGPGPPGGYDGSPAASSSSMASASSKSVYYPPTGQEYGRPAGKSGSGSIVTGQAAPGGPTNSRSNPSSQGPPAIASAASQAHVNDRMEDRKFVESMLKKKTSPSSDVMADLQAGKFPTRIPQTLAPKKRVAAAAAAAAAAEAALAKAPVIQTGAGSPAVPSPAKVAKYEDSTVPRAQVGPTHVSAPPQQGPAQASAQGAPTYDGRYPNHAQGTSREGSYPSYGPAAHLYASSGKRPTVPEMSNGPAVHPSVITTNYHHHPQSVLQQHQQPQQYTPDARYYPHHSPLPVKPREEHIMPVYHPPHLRGGSAASYSSPHAYGYSKDEPNAHPPYPQHHSDPMAYHKGSPTVAPPFRYGDSLKAPPPPPPPEHTAVHHMQSHIHYTGASAGAIPKVGHGAAHQYQQPAQPQSQQQQQHHSSQPAAEPIAVPQYPPNVHPSYGAPQHHRGADQSVISKLRTSLELKEYEKQRINQLRKQPGMELGDEDRPQKAALPSPGPAPTGVIPSMHDSPSPSSRFRTKGELKGYTPLPTPSVVTKPPRSIAESPPMSLKREELGGEEAQEDGEEGKKSIVPPVDMDGASALDILDWGSACNEFVEQLQTGKKRGRRKRTGGTVSAGSAGGRNWPAIDSIETAAASVPEGSTTDLSAIPKEVLNSARSPLRLQAAGNGSESSSDEDKPLLLLRQQSQQQQKDQEEQRQVDGKAHAAFVQTEKAARNLREKQRFELQQKHEAKLGRSSSTDSETARLAFVTAQRAKARVRKLRHRSSVAATLSLKSSDGDGDVTADGAEDDRGKPGQKRVPHSLENSAKRKRIRGPGSRSSSSSSSSSSSESSAPAVVKKPESAVPRKRGRPKGTGAGGKRTQPSTSSRCQTSTIKQETNEKSDLSSDEESRAVRTPHKNGSTAANSEAAKRREGGAAAGNGSAGGSSGSGNGAGGKAQQGSKVSEGSACIDGGQKEKHPPAGAKKKPAKPRTNSRSKAESSSDSSSDSSASSLSDEEAEETMTRSRSKREAERRRSNSKVLRNDKIVENCPNQRFARTRADSERTPTKKGKARKLSVGEPTPKRSKSRVVESDSDGPKAGKELYEYKRSIKVPPELITIDGYMHRISSSLPDLDSPHHSDGSETFSEIVKKLNQRDVGSAPPKRFKTKAAAKQQQQQPVPGTSSAPSVAARAKEDEHSTQERKKIDDDKKFRSIIEILHRRCIAAQGTKPTPSTSGRGKGAKNAGKGQSNATSSTENTKPRQEFELLPTPGAESESLFSKNSKKKKSLFDTAILKSRTRTEQKAMQSKEMIREVFGGDEERPQSAPPLSCRPEPPPLFEEGLQNVTFDERYNELMRNIDRIVGELDGGGGVLVVPAAPKKRGRGHRTSRRKGSSGFDYIRKKKKPSQQHHHGNHQQQHGAAGANGLNGSIGGRKVTIFGNIEGKDETHISKEIRSWVLNKGAGESVMHKAARLGYTDVIVYCLERLDMDPDLKDNAGYTPLHEACAKGHLDIANYLLQYGASHSEPAQSGMRPLHEAVENSFVEIVRLLLAFGADPMLATYRGMTPMELAESDDMTLFLEHHLNDVQSMAPNKIGWKFDGPWKIHDPEESGCNIFSDIPGFDGTGGLTSLNTSGTSSSSNSGAISSASSKRCDSNSNIMHYEVGESVTSAAGVGDSTRKRNGITNENLPAGLRNGKIKRGLPKQQEVRLPNGATVPRATTKLSNGEDRANAEQQDLEMHDAGSDGEDGEIIFEYEEADRPLPPLYILKDEYNERWMLMSDLCSFLKFKSKEAVLRQICPNNSTNSQRELIREMKIEEFLTRANCLQLLCAGEKLNIHASKVVLVKYNDSVKNLLQVQSFIARI
uniref:ANK_REP_REGION domain-containing protein n=1 Tax=Anopheles stephensi TaxID=30069 RepID=A0A182XZ08_ANOST